MRPAAKVDEGAVAIEGDRFAFLREALDEVDLHEVVLGLEVRQPLFARLKLADEPVVARNHLGHLRLDRLQIFRRKRSRPIKVVEEASLSRRTVPQLGLRKKLEHRRCQHVRGRVANYAQCIGVFLCEQLQFDIFRQRRAQVHQPLGLGVLGGIHRSLVGSCRHGCRSMNRLNARHHRGGGEARRDTLGHLEWSYARGELLQRSIGKCDLNGISGIIHKVEVDFYNPMTMCASTKDMVLREMRRARQDRMR